MPRRFHAAGPSWTCSPTRRRAESGEPVGRTRASVVSKQRAAYDTSSSPFGVCDVSLVSDTRPGGLGRSEELPTASHIAAPPVFMESKFPGGLNGRKPVPVPAAMAAPSGVLERGLFKSVSWMREVFNPCCLACLGCRSQHWDQTALCAKWPFQTRGERALSPGALVSHATKEMIAILRPASCWGAKLAAWLPNRPDAHCTSSNSQ